MIEKIRTFMQEAGEIALNGQAKVDLFDARLKENYIGSVVTSVDLAISELFRQFVRENFADLDYLIIDEETLSELGDDPLARTKKHEYVFVIDPIDGTMTYAAKYPLYAISVGVFRNQEPIAGVLYVPAMQKLVCADETEGFLFEEVFSENEKAEPLVQLSENQESLPVLLGAQWKLKNLSKSNRHENVLVDLYSAVIQLLFVATGQAKGYLFDAFLWDIAGSLAILKYVGVGVFDVETGKEMAPFSAACFGKQLKVKTQHVVCRKKYLPYYQSLML